MSKPTAPAELANVLSVTPRAATRRPGGGADGASFASLFPAHQPVPAPGPGGNKLPAAGNKLPQGALPGAARTPIEVTAGESGSAAVELQVAVAATMQPAIATPAVLPVVAPSATGSEAVTPPRTAVADEAAAAAAADVPGRYRAALAQTAVSTPVIENLAMGAERAASPAVPASTPVSATTQSTETGTPSPLQSLQGPQGITAAAPQLQAGRDTDAAQASGREALSTMVSREHGTQTAQLTAGASQQVQLPVTLAIDSLATASPVAESASRVLPEALATASQALAGSTEPAPAQASPVQPQAVANSAGEPLPGPLAGLQHSGVTPAAATAENRAAQGAGDVAENANRAVLLPTGADDSRPRTTEREVFSGLAHRMNPATPATQAGGMDLQQSLQEQRDAQAQTGTQVGVSRTGSQFLASLQGLTEFNASPLPSARVPVAVGQQGWDRAVGQQLSMFVSQDVSAAKLHLNPQHLGPMELQIKIDGDKANVAFLSQHSVVREALESSLPRLREMLADSGLNLVNVNVSQQGASSQGGHSMNAFRDEGAPLPPPPAGSTDEVAEELVQAPTITLGLIDDYA